MIQIFSLVELGAQQELQVRGMMGLTKRADMHQTSKLRPGRTQRGKSVTVYWCQGRLYGGSDPLFEFSRIRRKSGKDVRDENHVRKHR